MCQRCVISIAVAPQSQKSRGQLKKWDRLTGSIGLGHRTGDVHKGEVRYGDCFNVLVFKKGDYICVRVHITNGQFLSES